VAITNAALQTRRFKSAFEPIPTSLSIDEPARTLLPR
jgi:hypothetical protein